MISLEEILGAMRELATYRPIFHSEADFQHALAWQIHLQHSDTQMRLEYPPLADRRVHLDLWIVGAEQKVAVELKYPTHSLSANVCDEVFNLHNHAAMDTRRYDFILDIVRLERVVVDDQHVAGFAILLTNERHFWDPPLHTGAFDEQFHLYEGRQLAGTLEWDERAAIGTKLGRESPLPLTGTYRVEWRDYSQIQPNQPFGRFRFLVVEARP